MNSQFNPMTTLRWLLPFPVIGAVAAPIVMPSGGYWVSLAIVAVFAIFFGLFSLWTRWRKRREQQQFESALNQQSTAAPRSINDPNKRAKLDDLRQKFMEGIKVYQSRGKDLYSLPWYVFVGEPGSGKTEAIRRCNVGFPPGLQDEFQGTGGTVNMHWWFTNEAVFLDTAGRLMFEEVRPGDSSEWKEFLKLLRKTRPRSPFNGLFLVIPVESLIRDSADKIAQKAGRIAQQMDLIQRTLDIRFPVYIIITKCDLLTGFREFFDEINDPAAQHQILGWSNPDPLDSPFRPDLVDTHLEQVSQRLRKRRFALLRDPISPMSLQTRRTDEVDALFALPESLLLIAPRLRRYLETIFIAGEWSSKPLFLRGIYFTSSMRQGAELDASLAQALGLEVAELPQTRAWDPDRAFFLRDLFREKAFKEKGLVTRASNTKVMRRNRQLALFGTAAAALVAVAVFSWFGWRSLGQTIREESLAWQQATNGWSEGYWKPVVRAESPTEYSYVGNQPLDPGASTTLAEYHLQLQQKAARPLEISWIFKPMARLSSRELDRRGAQRILFERSVLRPILDATRAKMVEVSKSDEEEESSIPVALHNEALFSLIRLEVDLLQGVSSFPGTPPTNALQRSRQYLGSWIPYLEETEQFSDKALVEAMAGTYTQPTPIPFSPPLSGGSSLAANQAIDKGLVQFLLFARQNSKDQEGRLAAFSSVRSAVRELQKTEERLHAAARDSKPIDDPSLNAFFAARAKLDRALKNARESGLFTPQVQTLYGSYTNLMTNHAVASGASLKAVLQTLPPTTNRLFAEIRKKVQSHQEKSEERIRSVFSADPEVEELDARYLADYDLQRKLYGYRADQYQLAYEARKRPFTGRELIGNRWERYKQVAGLNSQLQEAAKQYKAPLEREFSTTLMVLVAEAEKQQKQGMLDAYVTAVQERLQDYEKRPVREASYDFLQDAGGFYTQLRQDEETLAVLVDQGDRVKPVYARAQSAKGPLVSKYLQYQQQQMKQVLGFPFLLDEETALNPDQCKAAGRYLKTVQSQMRKELLDLFGEAAFKPLLDRMQQLTRLSESLLKQDETLLRYTLSVVPDQNPVGVVGRFRYFTVQSADRKSGPTDVATGRVVTLASGSAADSLKLEIRYLPDNPAPVSTREFFTWGPLELIRAHRQGLERSPDGRKWIVPFSIRTPEGVQVIKLQVEFDQPLPEIEMWPTKTTIQFI